MQAVLSLYHFGMPPVMFNCLEYLNDGFALIFTLEALLKITGYGFAVYWANGWNRFDFLIMVGSDVGLVLTLTNSVSIGAVATVLRAFRLGR